MIIILWRDLLLKSRIREQAAQSGCTLLFAKSPKDLENQLKAADFRRLIVDLGSDPSVLSQLTFNLPENLDSVAVVSHVDIETQKQAREYGFRTVIPRSAFVNRLSDFLS